MKYAIPFFLLTCFMAPACGSENPPATPLANPSKAVQQETVAPPPADTIKPDKKPVKAKDQMMSPPKGAGGDSKAASGEAAESAAPGTSVPALGSAYRHADARNFTELLSLDSSIRLDIRYATANNFTKAKIYDCPRCFLRPEAAQAIVKAHRALQRQGLGLKLFDCYRPRPYQQRLWEKVPNPDYVTPPAKGSMHSRGAAVDLTIVDAQGKELDMGTPYDFFGPEAHYDYTRLPAKVLENRRLLRRTLENAGFQGIRTEWWHFSYRGKEFPLADFVWECR